VTDADLTRELFDLADALGVQLGYWDTKGAHHVPSVEALVAVLAAGGAPVRGLADVPNALRDHVDGVRTRPLEPVVVVWDDSNLGFTLCLPEPHSQGTARVEVHFEHGGEQAWDVDLAGRPEHARLDVGGTVHLTRRVEVHGPFVTGYHRLDVLVGSEHFGAHLLVAPRRVVRSRPDERTWGVLAPVYGIRAELGIGPHVRDLGALAKWIDQLGGKVVATLPLLASYLDEPFDPSPYAPVSRCFWNELFVDVERLPELAHSPAARSILDAPATQREIAALRADTDFAYRRQAALARPVLAELARTFFEAPAGRRAEFDRYLVERPDVVDYARFRATVERRGTGWHAWPEPMRSGTITADEFDDEAMRYHLYAQFSMHVQMAALSADLADRGQRLYLDLPVGANGDGYDTWRNQDLFAWGTGTGAPPDDFFTEGQNWGLPPVAPAAARESGHRHFAECIRHHMSVAGMLRLDHVMGLQRLYWVPDGMSAREGVYVRYPTDELFAVLCIESRRHDCIVVGEDLGTVPDEVRESMNRHELLGMYVSQFRQPTWPGAELASPTADQVASINTHDTPTFAGYLDGTDISRRRAEGLADEAEAEAEWAERRQARENLEGFLGARGLLDEGTGPAPTDHALLRGVLRFLGASDAPTVLVALEDLWDELNPQNIPGTGLDRPNWVHKMRDSLAALADDARLQTDLDVLQRSRLAAYARAKETQV